MNSKEMKDKGWVMWIAAAVLTITASVSGYAIARVDTLQQRISVEYVQKLDYRTDMGRIESALKSLNDKMDKVLIKEK